MGPGTTTIRTKSIGPREQRAREDERKPGQQVKTSLGEGSVRKSENSGLWYVPGDALHGQTRVEKMNKCLLNEWIINGKAGDSLKLLEAGAFPASPLNNHPVWELWFTSLEVQVPCQHQPLISMSQCRELQVHKANYSSLFLGTKADIPTRFLWQNCSIW